MSQVQQPEVDKGQEAQSAQKLNLAELAAAFGAPLEDVADPSPEEVVLLDSSPSPTFTPPGSPQEIGTTEGLHYQDSLTGTMVHMTEDGAICHDTEPVEVLDEEEPEPAPKSAATTKRAASTKRGAGAKAARTKAAGAKGAGSTSASSSGPQLKFVRAKNQTYVTMLEAGSYKLLVSVSEKMSQNHATIGQQLRDLAQRSEASFQQLKALLMAERTRLLAEQA